MKQLSSKNYWLTDQTKITRSREGDINGVTFGGMKWLEIKIIFLAETRRRRRRRTGDGVPLMVLCAQGGQAGGKPRARLLPLVQIRMPLSPLPDQCCAQSSGPCQHCLLFSSHSLSSEHWIEFLLTIIFIREFYFDWTSNSEPLKCWWKNELRGDAASSDISKINEFNFRFHVSSCSSASSSASTRVLPWSRRRKNKEWKIYPRSGQQTREFTSTYNISFKLPT